MAETRFHSLLKAKIIERRIKMADNLISGACADFETYKYQVGILQGLDDALKLCDEVEQEFD